MDCVRGPDLLDRTTRHGQGVRPECRLEAVGGNSQPCRTDHGPTPGTSSGIGPRDGGAALPAGRATYDASAARIAAWRSPGSSSAPDCSSSISRRTIRRRFRECSSDSRRLRGHVVAVTHYRTSSTLANGSPSPTVRGGRFSALHCWREAEAHRMARSEQLRAPAHAARDSSGRISRSAPVEGKRATAYERLLAEANDTRTPRARDRDPPGRDSATRSSRSRPSQGSVTVSIEDTFSLPKAGSSGASAHWAGNTLFRMPVGRVPTAGRRDRDTVHRATWTRTATNCGRQDRLPGDHRRRRTVRSHARFPALAYVSSFNFLGPTQKLVGTLSGGDGPGPPSKLLPSGGNVLLLDEPTNDLASHAACP